MLVVPAHFVLVLFAIRCTFGALDQSCLVVVI